MVSPFGRGYYLIKRLEKRIITRLRKDLEKLS